MCKITTAHIMGVCGYKGKINWFLEVHVNWLLFASYLVTQPENSLFTILDDKADEKKKK